MPTTVTPASPAPAVAPPAPPLVRLRLLGETAIDVDGVPVGPESQVLFALLLVLALERGRRLARTALHRLLWPAADDESGRHNLRQVLYKLRQLGVPVDATQSSVMLPSGLVTGELVALTNGDHTIGTQLAGGRRLGDFLPGYAPSFSAPFADWLDEQRALVQAQLRRALLGALAAARALGQWREVEALAREVLRVDPLNEEATLALAEATALAGAKAQALGIIDRYLDEVGGRSSDLRLPATLLRRRIAERFPTHRYVNAADACFVGRSSEMATLLGIWHHARDRRGSAVLLWGEPGIGKTRLAHELGRVATLQGAQVQRVASRSWDVQRPLGAIVDLVPGLRELPGAAGVDPQCNAYLDRLTKHDPDRPLADLPDPATLHRQVRQAVFDLIDALLAEAPLVLVLEDVQWLDASSWEVLAELLRLARTRRLLLVLTSRTAQPAQMPESEDWEALRRLRLDGIDAAATNELLDAMTREAGKYIDPDYREWCVPLANGNPLHTQEIALQWLEKGSVREAPGSLLAITEARLNALPSAALRALQACTLASTNASLRVIAASVGESQPAVIEALQALEQQRFITYTNNVLRVRHDIVAEQALATLEAGPRALLHDRIASELLATAIATRAPALFWDCYQHWTHAGLEGPAIHALTAFSDHLLASGRVSEAEQLLAAALKVCTSEQNVRVVRERLVDVSVQLGRWTQIEMLQPTPTRKHSRGSDDAIGLIEARWRRGGDVVQLQRQAVQLARRVDESARTRVRAATWALILADNAGDPACAARLDGLVLPLIERLGRDACYGYHYQLISANQQSDVHSLRVAAKGLASTAPRHVPLAERVRLLRHAAQGLCLAGELEEAFDALQSALDIAGELNATHCSAVCAETMAALCLYRHDTEAVRSWAARAARSYQSTDDGNSTQAVSYLLFQADAADGQVAAAMEHIPVLGEPVAGDSDIARNVAQRAVRIRAVTLSQTLDDSLLSELNRCEVLLAKHRSLLSCEFLAASLTHAYLRLGLTDAARRIFTRYMKEIRVRCGPLHVDLDRVSLKLSSRT